MSRRQRRAAAAEVGPEHAPGHRHLGPPPTEPEPPEPSGKSPHDQPWVPKSGFVGRLRRSPRR